MSRTSERSSAARLWMDKLLATGDGAPSLARKCEFASMIRAESPETSQQLDRMLLGNVEQLRAALGEARSNLNELKEVLDKITAPPWHMGVFICPIDECPVNDFAQPGQPEAPEGQRVMVYHGGSRRVVNLAEGLEAEGFALGDEVFLNAEANLVIGKSAYGAQRVGETALFDRYTDDGRLVVRWRDEELIFDAAGQLDGVELDGGDQLRVDRSAWVAYEKIQRAAGRRYFLSEVPNATPDQVGGQRGPLRTLLSALTTVLVAPEKAKIYGLSGRQSILMVGPPGCGKTLMARVAAYEIARINGRQCRFAVVKPSEWEDPYVGVTQQNIRNCFQALREAAKEGYAILFLDEIESVGRIRGSVVGHHSDRFLAALLAEMDGFDGREGVAIICATNRKGLADPAFLERISDVEIEVNRPDMRGAREIFQIHLPESTPFSPNGKVASETRNEIVERAVSRLYTPNAENELCVIRFRDGKSRTVAAREMISGRTIEQICRAARQAAFLRDVEGGEAGLRVEDIDEAVCGALSRLSTTLSSGNARAYLGDLPQDIDVVAVEPIARRVGRSHRYLNVT